MATNTFSGTGNWSDNARWSLGRPPTIANADKIVIAASAVCTVDGVYSAGDDTTTAFANNGLVKHSRTVSSSMTIRGAMPASATLASKWDMGTEADPIPAGVTASLIPNDSAAQGTNKFAYTMRGFSAWGVDKTLNTKVASFTSSSVFRVPEATNWAVGDWLYFSSTDSSLATFAPDVRAIQAISAVSGGFEITLAAGVSASVMVVGRHVVNLTRNVKVYGLNNQTYATNVSVAQASGAPDNSIEIGPFEVIGSGASTTTVALYAALSISAAATTQIKACKNFVCHNVSAVSGSTVTQAATGQFGAITGLSLVGGASNLAATEDFVVAFIGGTQGGISTGVMTGAGGTGKIVRPRIFGVGNPIRSMTGAFSSVVESPTFVNGGSVAGGLTLGEIYVNGGSYESWYGLLSSSTNIAQNLTTLEFSGVDFSSATFPPRAAGVSSLIELATAAFCNAKFMNCAFPAGYGISRTANSSSLSTAAEKTYLQFLQNDGDATNNFQLKRGGRIDRDNATKKYGASSIRFDCWYSSNPLTDALTFTLAAGATATVRGAMRYNAAYGTSTPPTVTLTGSGLTTQAATCPTTGADVWHDFTVSIANANAYPTTITVTMSGQSAANSTGAYCYFDGVTDSPWIDTAREFGYVYADTAYRTVDPSITVSEATALAYPVTFDHTAQTFAVTGDATARQVYEAFKASLAQTANMDVTNAQANERVYTTDGGVTFGTTYNVTVNTGCTLTGSFTTTGTVTLAGTGAVVGRYVDNSGAHVSISAPALVSGSRVQLYNVTDSAELYNDVLSGTGLVLPTTWMADKTIRLRADHSSKVALEVLGILSSIGLSFLDTQIDDTAYTNAGIDGSTVTEFAADNVDIQAEVTDSDNVTTWQRLYAWWQHYQTTSAGVASPLFGRFRSSDGANFYLDRSGGANVTIRNNKTDPLRFTGGYLQTSDGSIPFDLTGGNIFPDYGKVYVPPSYAADTAAAVVVAMPAPLVLDNGEQLLTVNTSTGVPKYLARG